MSKQTPESALLRLVLDYLAAQHILAFRMNTGAVKTENRFFRFGVPGMGDVLAFPVVKSTDGVHIVVMSFIVPTWLELKAAKGKQTELQKSFQAQVEGEGHRYAVIRNLEDLKKVIA